jgi:UBA-like domain
MAAPPGRDELVAQFVGITNAPASDAEHILEAAGWDLDTAAQLHFEGTAAIGSAPQAARIADDIPNLDDLMNNARGSRADAAVVAAATMVGEDGVRMADSVKRERLFDTRHARQPRISMSHVGPDVQQMPFGDLDPDASKRTGPGLDSIYQPPTEILSSLQLPEYDTRLIFINLNADAGTLTL